ncbi:interleukin-20 receptor subunit beta [Vanacampus margaritifer]
MKTAAIASALLLVRVHLIHSVRTVPQMTVSTVGGGLQVSFEEAPPTASMEVEVWKRSDAPGQVLVLVIPAEQKLLPVHDLQDGAEYCVRARVLLKEEPRSPDTQEKCVRVADWSAPGHVTMGSINMKHILGWDPPPAPCSSPRRYSVQFQGEFERTHHNGTWTDSPECQDVTQTHCDQTLDLGSESDYNIRVRARCAHNTSAWAQLAPPFNRRHTVLTVPQMTVSAMGGGLQVSFEEAPPKTSIEVEVWKRGDAPGQVLVLVIPAEQKLLPVHDLQVGAEYCVRARVLLKEELRSPDTKEKCVTVTRASWKIPTAVVLTLLLMTGVAFATYCCVVRCRSQRYYRCVHKEALPPSLLVEGPAPLVPVEREELELCAAVQVVPKDQRLQAVHNGDGLQRGSESADVGPSQLSSSCGTAPGKVQKVPPACAVTHVLINDCASEQVGQEERSAPAKHEVVT